MTNGKEESTGRTARHILSALSATDGWISSAGIVKTLDISRMAISKQVRRLRALGYDIKASTRLGYRLAGRTDLPVPEEVQPLLHNTTIGRNYRYVASIDSTNSFLRTHMSDLPNGSVLTADTQTHGRGRMQHTWFSPSGTNLYISILLKPDAAPTAAPQLSLVAASGLLRALYAQGCSEAMVKWPNDILCNGKKIAGILCEMEAESDMIHGVVIGIGVNVNTRDFPADLRKIATSLIQLQGKQASRPALAAGILNCLEEDYAEWNRNGLTNILPFLNKHSFLAGREVTATLSHETIRGRVEKIMDSGSLRVVLANGTKVEISSGEVKLCRA